MPHVPNTPCKMFSHQVSAGARYFLQHYQVATVVVDHRQRTFEIHLPQFIGCSALEPLRRRVLTLVIVDQTVTQQNAMDRAPRQLKAALPQQHCNLRAPQSG